MVFFVLLHLILVGIDRLIGIVVGDLELHLVEELRGVQDLADDEDRLSTQIREEGDGNQAQDGRQTRCTHQILDRLADEQAVITAWIEASILEEGRKEFRKGDGSPDHNDHQRHKPLQQVDAIGPHQVDARQEDEGGNHKGGNAKAALDEVPGQIGSHAAAGVAELLMRIEELTIARCLDHRLVGGSRREIRDEGQRQIDGQHEEQHAQEEIETLVLEYILEADSFQETK